MKMNTVECCNCKKLFSRKQKSLTWNAKHKFNNFCSSECSSIYRKLDSNKECDFCGKEFYLNSVRRLKSKYGKNFCSRTCSTSHNNKLYKSGVNHPSYVNGKAIYRKMALDYYPHKCVKCDYSIVEILQVDHIDGNRNNNDLSNLQILCPTHHWEKTLGLDKVIDST